MYEDKAGQVLVRVVNINKHEVILGFQNQVSVVYPAQEVHALCEPSWCLEATVTKNSALTRFPGWAEAPKPTRQLLLEEMHLERANLSPGELDQLSRVLDVHSIAFSHHKTVESQPVQQRYHQVPYQCCTIKRSLIMQPIRSLWSSLIVLVKKRMVPYDFVLTTGPSMRAQ